MLPAILFVLASVRPFHLQLESSTAVTFPLLRRFGTITTDIYPAGFRSTSIWLRAFSRNGSRTVTVENSVTRTYVVMPMSDAGDIVRVLGGHPIEARPPTSVRATPGFVGRLSATRFRLMYAPNEFIDVWTTSVIGPAPAFRAFVDGLIRALSPTSAAVLRSIPGTPLYVELNIGRYRRFPMLRTRSIVFNHGGEQEALRISPFMFPAPFGTIFK